MAGNPGFKTGNVLGATAFPIDLDALVGELGHASFALINDDASAVLTAVLDGQSMTIPAKGQIKVSGSGNSKQLSLTSTVNPTAFRLQTSPSKIPPEFVAPGGTTVVTANLADGAVTGIKVSLEKHVALAAAADRVTSAGAPVSTPFATVFTVPANRLVAGTVIQFEAGGKCPTGTNGASLQLTARLGTTAIGLISGTGLNIVSGDPWYIRGSLVVRTTGAGGKFCGNAEISLGLDGAGTNKKSWGCTVDGAIDTTATADVNVLVDWDANANDTVDLNWMTVRVLN